MKAAAGCDPGLRRRAVPPSDPAIGASHAAPKADSREAKSVQHASARGGDERDGDGRDAQRMVPRLAGRRPLPRIVTLVDTQSETLRLAAEAVGGVSPDEVSVPVDRCLARAAANRRRDWLEGKLFLPTSRHIVSLLSARLSDSHIFLRYHL